MMSVRRGELVVTIVALLLIVAALPAAGAQISPSLSSGPSHSVVLYKRGTGGDPSRLRTGTLDPDTGSYTQKAAFRTGRWSDIAVGRDSIALYDKMSGRLMLGTLKGGRFVKRSTTTMAKGYTHVAASCDSIAFYKSSTGAALTAEFTAGQMRDKRKTNLGAGYESMEASCDMLFLIGGFRRTGLLRFGSFDPIGGAAANIWLYPIDGSAANRTSFLLYRRDTGSGVWGRLHLGVQSVAETVAGLNDYWGPIAGVGDFILFYRRLDGSTVLWDMVDGVETELGLAPNLGKGLTLIAGGR